MTVVAATISLAVNTQEALKHYGMKHMKERKGIQN